ncbi:YkoP family protein [Parageobacillus thermoglucosidasius]|uniref:YkoP-like domain-containing protein n=1 Tax=Parageobacillus thermoglucosidasius TaxID=1426 RepID=A0AB38R531_PARTM|nr:hypothetical protein [Parageobacillus thermoglucosidasius]UOE77859.1 hypothetical protein IMI45_08890 [Parageobacillus thermoglucosidasius]GCD82837.1 hypothetical protein PTHTG4_19000 [Parageobacillus thermoglucosidasius]
MKEKARQCALAVWGAFDPIYYACSRLEYVGDTWGRCRPVFRVRVTKYKGREVVLSDGTKIQKNDLLVKIHLHNVRLIRELLRLDSEIKKGRYIFEQVKAGLPYIANYIRNHEQFSEIKGIIGITMLNKGCERLGFETFSIVNPFYKWFKTAVMMPMIAISQLRFSPVRRPPKYLFMSKEKLLTLYDYQPIH